MYLHRNALNFLRFPSFFLSKHCFDCKSASFFNVVTRGTIEINLKLTRDETDRLIRLINRRNFPFTTSLSFRKRFAKKISAEKNSLQISFYFPEAGEIISMTEEKGKRTNET